MQRFPSRWSVSLQDEQAPEESDLPYGVVLHGKRTNNSQTNQPCALLHHIHSSRFCEIPFRAGEITLYLIASTNVDVFGRVVSKYRMSRSTGDALCPQPERYTSLNPAFFRAFMSFFPFHQLM